MRQRARRLKSIAGLMIGLLVLSGCVEMTFSTVRTLRDETERLTPRAIWYKQAQRGDAEAQYALGKSYCCGKRPAYNNHEALFWWCKAAKKGQRDALFGIANLYENAHKTEGSILPRDMVMARTYYALSGQYGHAKAWPKAEELWRGLSGQEQLRAQNMLGQWPNIPCGSDLPDPR